MLAELTTYELTIAALFQDEARYLREWIEYHRIVGVDHFVLVNDRSRDAYAAVLAPYMAAGVVELIDAPCPLRLQGDWVAYQLAVLNELCAQLRGVSRWVAFIDLDEFLVPAEGETLRGLLHEHAAYGAIYARWEPFGSGHVAQLKERDLITERLQLKWRFIAGHDMLGKSIVQPARVLRAGVHRCKLLPGFAEADCNPGMASPTARLKVHHYWSRDERTLVEVKLPRAARIKGWQIDDDRVAFFKTLFNDVRDDRLARVAPALRRRVFADGVPDPPARGGRRRRVRG